jgi:hypothetical protein
MSYPKASSLWGGLVPAIAFVAFLGCSSSASQPVELTPSTPASTENAPTPPAAAETKTYDAGEFVNGKMWTFEYAPIE